MTQESLITPPAEGNADAGTPPADSGTPPAAERPDWLPEKFWTPEGPSVENLAKSYVELEKMRGASIDQLKEQWEGERLAVRPETPDAYELPSHDALDAEQLAASPVVGLFRKIAHETGLSQDQFAKTIADYAEAEVSRLQETANAEMKALGENGKQRAEAVGLWANQRFGSDPAKFAAIAQICTTAAGVEAIEELMKEAGAPAATGDAGNAGGNDLVQQEAEIRKLMDSREYYDPKHRDPAVVAKVEAFFAKKYGGK
ncbi:MAG: hypothetical protein LW689_06905 [Novosphingobium sp.]|jgi:hypothetical protein|nr:hypothetical protein [Novosphingobium sp.]MCE2842492.1 hypothetical protein [Novosphingobium sp.]